MTELNTLEKIPHYDEDSDENSDGEMSYWISESKDGDYVKESELRQEAIKWVKYFENEGKIKVVSVESENHPNKIPRIVFDKPINNAGWIICGLVNFFNLSEDDLK